VLNLYAKIFIGFWLSMIVIIASWMLAGRYIDPLPEQFDLRDEEALRDALTRGGQARGPELRGPEPGGSRPRGPEGRPDNRGMDFRGPGGGERPPRDMRPGPGPRRPEIDAESKGLRPPRNLYRIYYALQNINEAALPAWIEQTENETGLNIFLVNPQGKEILGRELIPGTEKIVEKLSGFRRRTALREGRISLFGQEIHRPGQGMVIAIVANTLPASPIMKALTEHLWLRLLLAIVISGLISYAVSRYLTRPLKQLQLASRKLASGDLDARIDVPDRGGDETDELARDFNSMAEQLQREMQAQKRLLRDVSHELRSPLARLRVALALAEQQPEKQAEQLRRIERETERLDELIGQLLAVPENKINLEDSLDLVILLRELSDDASFEAQQENKSILYRTVLDEAVVKTRGDLLKKALENVIRNALGYTSPGSSVLIELDKTAGFFRVSVTDQGPGIPEAALDRIFEPFYRVDDARQRETGGYGLGLSIASRSIKQHNGSIRAENTGTGLMVEITLPI
jgi:signal transduction histidine kinase